MADLLHEKQDSVWVITLNRVHKHNAFDERLLMDLERSIQTANTDRTIRVIVLQANGKHFSAGADLEWMQRVAQFDEAENLADAGVLARVLFALYQSTKPTIAMVQGKAIGGGAGLVAACDLAIAADNAQFCFAEVKLGLIPAVISPYVIKAIGARSAHALFVSAEQFDAKRAYELQLIHHCVAEVNLAEFTMNYAQRIAGFAPDAVKECKTLVRTIESCPIDAELQMLTAGILAKKRSSSEARRGISAFLNQELPKWD